MELYRFSPINNSKDLIEAVKYIAIENSKLCKKVIGEELPIISLTVFSHFNDEFEELIKILAKLGKPFNENNGPRVKLDNPIIAQNNTIKYLRIRKPDPYRTQVGCNDFEVEDYNEFKNLNLNKNDNLRLIAREDFEMIEFFDPEFDVFGYIVNY